ncbi:MAG: hypothetical protein CML31_14765 [Rhizobiales bacterium]|nr:hypothetical protein [Hoeflea sp.]MBG21190.1 hypothetical protein [Hyphomicrobiales bacterium]|tara:strand:+ start:310 stop:561 length:252 start_codon:yes stop_codon:yes gene_type:complete
MLYWGHYGGRRPPHPNNPETGEETQMEMNTQGRTAQIIEFPRKFRRAGGTEDAKFRGVSSAQALVPVLSTDCWYHDAAMKEEN